MITFRRFALWIGVASLALLAVPGSAAGLVDLKKPAGFVLLETTFDEIRAKWGAGKLSETSTGAGHHTELRYNYDGAEIRFSGSELAGNAIDYFSIQASRGIGLPTTPLRSPFVFAGFRLGMSKDDFLKNLEQLRIHPANYRAHKLVLKKDRVSQKFTGIAKTKVLANSRWSQDKTEHWEDHDDYLDLEGRFDGNKLVGVWVYTTIQ